jgi:alkylated DNA repair dioxygenase AlkB
VAELLPAGLHYDPAFVDDLARQQLISWLSTLHPLWENRLTERAARAQGGQRRLLRPTYWLGNWQFACLDYYRPPRDVHGRCVAAEPYPAPLAALVARIEARARALFAGPDLPARWHLNTCLVNLYGSRLEQGRWRDCARVGEHRDFEPGPVASLSLGARALFQFVRPGARDAPTRVAHSAWLDDGSLLLFAGDPWKRRTLHRVLRVERGAGEFDLPVQGFRTRRVNFTFRYVPDEHIAPFAALSEPARSDVRPYVEQLARHAPFWAHALAQAPAPAPRPG